MKRTSSAAVAVATLICLGGALLAGCRGDSPADADLVLINGSVYTLAWGEPSEDGTYRGMVRRLRD